MRIETGGSGSAPPQETRSATRKLTRPETRPLHHPIPNSSCGAVLSGIPRVGSHRPIARDWPSQGARSLPEGSELPTPTSADLHSLRTEADRSAERGSKEDDTSSRDGEQRKDIEN